MADNYTQCTVDPCLPKDWFTDKDRENLEAQSFEFVDLEEDEPNKKGLYFICAPENLFWPPHDDEGEEIENCPEWSDIFQDILKRENSDIQIVVEACFFCTRMRVHEFGGFCALITKDRCFRNHTHTLLNEFRAKIAAEKETQKEKI
jgi:hypothetical protein